MNPKQTKLLKGGLLAILVLHVVLSAWHYYNLPLDGDYPRIGLPFRWYEDIMADPWGWQAAVHGKMYAGAGRFFCHGLNWFWFHKVYAVVHAVVQDPVNSIYLTNTSAAMLVHGLFLMAVQGYTFIRKPENPLLRPLLLVFSSVFIQYNTLYESIGLIDRSASYIFFYGMPLMIMALLFMPLYRAYHQGKTPSRWWTVCMVLIGLPLALSSVLVQPIFFVACAVGAVAILHPNSKQWRLFLKRPQVAIGLGVFLVYCLYAFYVSRFNSEKNESVALLERYQLLARGLWMLLTRNPIWPGLLVFIGLNTYWIKRFTPQYAKPLTNKLMVLVLFVLLFIGLLPLGGYRSYRPLIVRYDVIIPVTLAALYYVFQSSLFLVKQLEGKVVRNYAIGLAGIIVTLFLSNMNLEHHAHEEQKKVFVHLMQQKDTLIQMPVHCNVGTWSTDDYKDPYIMDMLTRSFREWGIIQPYQTLQGPK